MARKRSRVFASGRKLVPVRVTPRSPRRPRRQRRRPPRHRPARDAALAAARPRRRRWSLPGGFVREGESLEEAMRRHLREKVGVTDVGHLEQLDSRSADTHPELWLLDVSYLALIPRGAEPELPPDTEWHPVEAPARGRLRPRGGDRAAPTSACAASSPTRTRRSRSRRRRFTLRELADVYEAVLGYAGLPHQPRPRARPRRPDRSDRRPPPRRRAGGRPAAEFAFTRRELVVSRAARGVQPAGAEGRVCFVSRVTVPDPDAAAVTKPGYDGGLRDNRPAIQLGV